MGLPHSKCQDSRKESQNNASIMDATKEESPRIAHTLAACCRCRQRKTRCDTGLPRCGPCARTNSKCEFWDPAQRTMISRSYVVELQHRVKALEYELAVAKTDELEDPEVMMRSAASVRIQNTEDSQFLGPSSGIALTRLVLKLAKECTGAEKISDVVSDAQAKQIKAAFTEEEAKPFSKVYPSTSNIAAEGLPPDQGLVDRLVQLFNLRVQSILPILHEPTLQKDLEAVYAGSNDPYQNFVVRMVIAISLQKVDAQYAGLADSYYLAALQYLESNIRQMNLKTLQCCCLIGEYSLITPTRTAAYYIVGLAVRLLQSLGFTDERTISRMPDGGTADPLELDMRRRLFWNTWAMDLGLAHILGRPSALATSQEHIDVRFYNTADDRHITPEGIVPGRTLKKCLAIHFHKFRLLQLEIRRKLYLKKRDEPKDDRHPWFLQMEKRLSNWRDQSPEDDMGIGLDKIWFLGQYNTVIVMLYRPSPQIPRPSVEAVKKCFEACEFNVYMHRKQVEVKNVDLTWPFCSTVFQAINTILWSLSYVEIRRTHSRDKVEELLSISLDAMSLASQRWPGVASAHALYVRLMESCLKMYELDGDVPIMASSPEDGTSPESTHSQHRSRTDSPATISTTSIVTTPEDSSAAQRAYTLDSRLGLDSGISFDFPPPLHGLSSSVELDFGRLPTLAPLPSNPTLTAATGLPPAVPSSAPMASFSSPEAYESRTPRPSIPISPTAVSNSQPFRPVLEPDAESFLKPNPLPAFSSISSWDKPLRGGVDSFTSQNHMDHENPLPNARNYDVESEPYIDPCLDAHNPFSFVMDQYHGIGQAELSEQARSFSITGFQKAEKMIEESRNMFSCPPT